MEIRSILTDEAKETDGVWMPYRDGSEVKIASWASRKFTKHKETLEKPYERQRRLGINKDELDKIDQDILCRAMARSIVLDWRGFSRDEAPLAYSEQAAYELLTTSRIFRNEMALLAADESAFRNEDIKDTEKNSVTASPGN